MPIPIAKDQAEYKMPDVSGTKGQAPEIMRINTGLPEATNDLVKSTMNAHNVLARIKVDNDTVKANQLTLQLEQQLSDAMNSTETDENGNVIGFLHKQGEDAFNSLPELDKNIAGIYNGYLKEMSQLSPVAIEKLLLRGKDLVNDTQKNAFNYSYEQHEQYNKNNAIAMNNDIIANAKGTDGKLDDNFFQNRDIMAQNVRQFIAKGQSKNVQESLIRQLTENLVQQSLIATDEKHSNSPFLGGGSVYAVKELKDAFKKGLVGQQFFEKQLKTYEKEMCKTAAYRSGAFNYDKAKDLIISREGLNTEEKEYFLSLLDENVKKAANQSEKLLDDGTISSNFRLINNFNTKYETQNVTEELTQNPFAFKFDEKGGLQYYDRSTNSTIPFETWVKNRNWDNILKDEDAMSFVYNYSYFIDSLKNEQGAAKNLDKLRNLFNTAMKAPQTREEIADTAMNEEAMKDLKLETRAKYSNSKNKEIAIENAANNNMINFESATQASFNNKTNTQSKQQLDYNIGRMLEEAYIKVSAANSSGNFFQDSIDSLKSLKNVFAGEAEAFFDFDKERDSYIDYLTDDLIKYVKNAEKSDGFFVKIPNSKGQFEDCIYKGNINFGSILRDSVIDTLNDNVYKKTRGENISDKLNNMNDNNKKHFLDIVKKRVENEIVNAAKADSGNIISIRTGLPVSEGRSDMLASMYEYSPERTTSAVVVPFDQNYKQITRYNKVDYSNYAVSNDELMSMPEKQKNFVKGTYSSIVNTKNINKSQDLDYGTLALIANSAQEAEIEQTVLPSMPYGSLNTNALTSYTTINDIKNNKVVYLNDAKNSVESLLNYLESSYQKRYNEPLSVLKDASNINNVDKRNIYKQVQALQNLLYLLSQDSNVSYINKGNYENSKKILGIKVK